VPLLPTPINAQAQGHMQQPPSNGHEQPTNTHDTAAANHNVPSLAPITQQEQLPTTNTVDAIIGSEQFVAMIAVIMTAVKRSFIASTPEIVALITENIKIFYPQVDTPTADAVLQSIDNCMGGSAQGLSLKNSTATQVQREPQQPATQRLSLSNPTATQVQHEPQQPAEHAYAIQTQSTEPKKTNTNNDTQLKQNGNENVHANEPLPTKQNLSANAIDPARNEQQDSTDIIKPANDETDEVALKHTKSANHTLRQQTTNDKGMTPGQRKQTRGPKNKQGASNTNSNNE
jgi:hypothetical protein